MGIKDWLDGVRVKVATEAGRRVVERTADEALDDLEKALLGKVGAADELANKPEADPLDAVRQRYGIGAASSEPAPAPEDPVAKARAELDELKRKRKTKL